MVPNETDVQAYINMQLQNRDAAHAQELQALRDQLVAVNTQQSMAVANAAQKFSAPCFYGYGADGKIDGKEGPREWLRSFDGSVMLFNATYHTHMSEEIRKLQLRQHLKGTAGTWFQAYEDSYTTWDAFKSAFSSHYGLENLQVAVRLDLYKLKQGSKEDLRIYNNKYRHLNQQITNRTKEDSIFTYLQGLEEKTRRHMYVTHPYNTWTTLDAVMESALSYSLAGANTVVAGLSNNATNNIDVEMNNTYADQKKKTKKPLKWNREEWAQIQARRLCSKCGGEGHLRGQCTEKEDARLLVLQPPQIANAEYAYVHNMSDYRGYTSTPVHSSSRVVRVVSEGKEMNASEAQFMPGVEVNHDRTVYPTSVDLLDDVTCDREIHSASEDEVDYGESEEEVGGIGASNSPSMTLNSMNEAFIAEIDDSDR